MHTLTIPPVLSTPEIYVHHNSDWSGDALIMWMTPEGPERREVPAQCLVSGAYVNEMADVPPMILVRVVAAAASSDTMSRVRNAIDDL